MTSGTEEVGNIELDEYGGGGNDKESSLESLLECLRVKHKDSWHIRCERKLFVIIFFPYR